MRNKKFANKSRWRNWRNFSPDKNFCLYGTLLSLIHTHSHSDYALVTTEWNTSSIASLMGTQKWWSIPTSSGTLLSLPGEKECVLVWFIVVNMWISFKICCA